MDFRSPFTWYTVHLMCILSHSALFLAGSAGIAIGIEYDVVFSSGVAGLMVSPGDNIYATNSN